MTVNRRAIVSVAVGLCLTLGGCSTPPPGSPSPPPPPGSSSPPPPPEPNPQSPTAKVAVTVSSVAKATIAPERWSYTFRLQLADEGGVPSTVTEVDLLFDDGHGDHAQITGDALGQNRRLTANGTLDLELTSIPAWGWLVGNEVINAYVLVNLTDDNGHRVKAVGFIDKL